MRTTINSAKSKAAEYAKDPDKANELFEKATKKAKSFEGKKGPLGEMWKNLKVLFRIWRAYYRKEYRDIPWETVVWIIAAIVYFLSPIDLIPDFIPGAGYIDDALVIALAIRSIQADIDKFLIWEAAKI